MSQKVSKADCVDAMTKLAGTVDLIVADPPYNYGQNYDAYADNKSYAEYMAWTLTWLKAADTALKRNGSLWIFAPDEWVSEIDVMVKGELGYHKRQHVVWAFTFGQHCVNKFTRSHCHLLYYVRGKAFTFNTDAIRVPSARQLIYADKRANPKGKSPDDTWMLLEHQLIPYTGKDRDTWLESRICGTFKERKNHSPNQIPLPVMERIVLACSNPGDLVVDPFAGTCSSGVVCAQHGRNWEGFDISKRCVKEGAKRIAEAAPPSTKKKSKNGK